MHLHGRGLRPGRDATLRARLPDIPALHALPAAAPNSDGAFGTGAAIPDPTEAMGMGTDAATMDQLGFVLAQLTLRNLAAIEGALLDGGLPNALRYRAQYFTLYLLPNAAGQPKSMIQKVAAMLIIFFGDVQKSRGARDV